MLADESYDDLDAEEFVDPPAAYRPQPWWFWNGEMDPALMTWQIAQMDEAGCGGFYVTPRQGLGIPYLSAEYFRRFSLAIEEARERGMLVGIMDDFPYPSGMAGGSATWANPAFIRAELRCEHFECEGPTTIRRALGTGDVLRAWAWPVVDGETDWSRTVDLRTRIGVGHGGSGLSWGRSLTDYSYGRFGSFSPRNELVWDVPRGRWRVMVFTVDRCRGYKYYGEFLDTCNADAVAHFLRTTLGEHEAGLGRPLGERLRSVFTDETTGGNWTWEMPRLFEERCGYGLLNHLPALIDDDFPNAPRIRYDYLHTLHDLFMRAYHEQYAAECERRGLLYTTEVPMLRNADQAVTHIPGLDHAHERIGQDMPHGWLARTLTGFRHWPRFPASIAAQGAKPRVAVEAFHSLGWGVRIADLKALIDRMAALGVNLFALHGFYYRAGGPAKFDAAPSEFYQQPWWRHFRHLGDYAGRLSYLASRGRHAARIALLDPVTSCWTHGADEWATLRRLGADGTIGGRLQDDWGAISEALQAVQREFHHLDPLDLAKGEVREGRLVVGEAEYQALIVPPVPNLECAAFDRLREFAEAGGIVLWLGLLPFEEIEQGSPVIAQAGALFDLNPHQVAASYFGGAGAAEWIGDGPLRFLRTPGGLRECDGDGMMLDALDELLPARVTLDIDEDWRDRVLLHLREVAGRWIVLLANCAPVELTATIRLHCDAPSAEQWDAETGERRALSCRREGGRLACSATLPANGSVALVTGHAIRRPVSVPDRRERALDLTAPWRVAETARNILRLGQFRVCLGEQAVARQTDDSDWQQAPPEPLINVMARISGQHALPVRISPGAMQPPHWRVHYPVTATFRAGFHAEHIPEDLRLVADRNGLAGEARVFLNGRELPLDAAESDFIFDHSQLSWPVADLATPGRNVVAITIEAHADDDGLVDALWLAGSFGLGGEPGGRRTITAAPPEVVPLDLPGSGLPHFAGTLALESEIEMAGDETHLTLDAGDERFLDCAELFLGGEGLGVRCWPPYRWRVPDHMRGAGPITVGLEITTSAGPAIEGRAFDAAAGGYREL